MGEWKGYAVTCQDGKEGHYVPLATGERIEAVPGRTYVIIAIRNQEGHPLPPYGFPLGRRGLQLIVQGEFSGLDIFQQVAVCEMFPGCRMYYSGTFGVMSCNGAKDG